MNWTPIAKPLHAEAYPPPISKITRPLTRHLHGTPYHFAEVDEPCQRGGLNMAHEAVDRHANGERRHDVLAIR